MPATNPPTTTTDRPPRAYKPLDTLGEVARSRRALNTTLAVGCPRHATGAPGQPCWEMPNSVGTQSHLAVCAARVERARDVRERRRDAARAEASRAETARLVAIADERLRHPSRRSRR